MVEGEGERVFEEGEGGGGEGGGGGGGVVVEEEGLGWGEGKPWEVKNGEWDREWWWIG